MPTISDLPLAVRAFMRFYRFRSLPYGGGARLRRPLREARLAVVTTAGLYVTGQPPFSESRLGGDPTWREIPADAALQSLVIGHRSHSFDAAGLELDRNLALPLERLQERVRAGSLGGVNRRHFSFMGSITRTDPLVRETGPQVVKRLVEDAVDAALFTPV